MFKFTLFISTFILSFGLFFAYLTAFQYAPAPAQQAEQHPLVGIRPERAGQAMTSAAQLSAPGSPSSVPTVNFNDLSEKYRGCMLEIMEAQQAAKDHTQKVWSMQHYDPKTAEIQRQADFMRIKELCRLKFPCADGETVSDDYNSCRKS
jgi:hypothetical protein